MHAFEACLGQGGSLPRDVLGRDVDDGAEDKGWQASGARIMFQKSSSDQLLFRPHQAQCRRREAWMSPRRLAGGQQ